MQIQTFPADQLRPEHLEAWSHLQQSHSRFDSPYFRPEFTQQVAKVRPHVEVGVISQHGEPLGFFPFERGTGNVAAPVANLLSDFHAVVADPQTDWCPQELLKASKLSAWNFHHLLAECEKFEPAHWRVVDSPYMDLSEGFEAYRQARRKAGSQKTKQIAKKKRKLEREQGPVTVETDCRDERVFEQMLAWKSNQYQTNGLIDLFAMPWVVNLLHGIWQENRPEFCGRLYALYAKGQLVAAEFGMQSRQVLHSWFPSYDREFAKYGVGHILTLEIAQTAEELGIQRIDLGKGEESYKQSLATANTLIAEGSWDRNPLRRVVRKRCHQTATWLRSTAIRDTLRRPYRVLKKLVHQTGSWLTAKHQPTAPETPSSQKPQTNPPAKTVATPTNEYDPLSESGLMDVLTNSDSGSEKGSDLISTRE